MKQKIWYFFLLIELIRILGFPIPSTLAASLEEIKHRGKLIVAVKDNLRPLGFKDATGKLQGLEIDIAHHLAAELLGDPNAIMFVPATNQERLDLVMQGKVDLVIARVTQTTARARLVDFSPYYYLDGTGIVTQQVSVQKLEDLATAKIAVLRNSSTIAVIRYELPHAQLIGVNSYQEALNLLENQQADAFAADNSVLSGWVQEYPQYRLLSARLSGDALCVVMPRGLEYVTLRERVNAAISRWRKSAWLQERTVFWGLPWN
jgi:polar amino acid transport system substrate-binding protein